MLERIICRPMYSTDPGFKKGMKVLVFESTNKIIKKHFDNPQVPKEYQHLPLVVLDYNNINWELAGYVENKNIFS